MPKPRHRCKDCGRTDEVAGHISRRGLCMDCGYERYNDSQRSMIEKRGPVYDAYVAAWIAAAQRARRPITPYPPDA